MLSKNDEIIDKHSWATRMSPDSIYRTQHLLDFFNKAPESPLKEKVLDSLPVSCNYEIVPIWCGTGSITNCIQQLLTKISGCCDKKKHNSTPAIRFSPPPSPSFPSSRAPDDSVICCCGPCAFRPITHRVRQITVFHTYTPYTIRDHINLFGIKENCEIGLDASTDNRLRQLWSEVINTPQTME